MSFSWPRGATPLTTDELQGLIPTWVTTRGELDAVERANILRGERALLSRRRKLDILSEDGVFDLHRLMFGAVWRWAGDVRTSDKNIGVSQHEVRSSLRDLLRNARVWTEQNVFERVELAARFHHQLVKIHCFANGNGRHARRATDLLLKSRGEPPLAWGAGDLASESEVRARYIRALRSADGEDYDPLLDFLRT